MDRQGSVVEFKCGERTSNGYLVVPDGEGNRAAIVVIHEWWGLNDHIRDVASRFAGEGYVVLAPDLYDGKVTKDAEDAGRLMSSLDRGYALDTLRGAIEYLKRHNAVDGSRIGVTGFCMGGTYALALACHSVDVKAAAPFYGDIPFDDELKHLSSPVLFIGAENDFWITMDKMKRLENSLAKFGKFSELKIYSGVGHAFFNDTRLEAYNHDAARDAWNRVIGFFAKYL
ncbi:MAG: dienelactone hydrolase family protein [Acidobacteriota bacterium]